MTRPRGRPSLGMGVSRDDILSAALTQMEEGGGQGLTMRALATRLGVSPMSLYHHVEDRAGLLRALSDRVYAGVLEGMTEDADPLAEIRSILVRYHDAVRRHPQLTLAIFAVPEAFTGVTRQITDRLTALLSSVSTKPAIWRDILVDHAHGSGLPASSVQEGHAPAMNMEAQYRQSLDCLLNCLAGT
jgi:AcrR family transcriptional regulator